jgi:hypothetical protein
MAGGAGGMGGGGLGAYTPLEQVGVCWSMTHCAFEGQLPHAAAPKQPAVGVEPKVAHV